MSKKKTQKREAVAYRVAGPNVVLDHEPGETFEASLDPIVEERLLASGNLARAEEASASTSEPTDGADNAAAAKE